MSNKPHNFCVMTLEVQDVADSKRGKATIANATLGKSGMPVRIVATNGVRRWLKTGEPVTLLAAAAPLTIDSADMSRCHLEADTRSR